MSCGSLSNVCPAKTLRKMANDGLATRLEKHVFHTTMTDRMRETVAEPYHKRVQYELAVIEQMGFSNHFVIVADIIQWMKAQNIQIGPGFGSSPGSAVAWALTITDIDPLRWGLLFERFLNTDRHSAPDFFIELCRNRWEEGIQYAESKYGYAPTYVNNENCELPYARFNNDKSNTGQLPSFAFSPDNDLSHLAKAMSLIKQDTGIEIDLSTLPLDDPATYSLLSKGDTEGVFNLGSECSREVLTRMKPTRMEDLIATITLFRPGSLDKIPHYVSCKNGDCQPDYMHPSLEPILKETYGVIAYHEQVMQIAQTLCAYTLYEGDVLRRTLGIGVEKDVNLQRTKFIDRAIAEGVVPGSAMAIFDKLVASSKYLFLKSHAAAYALQTYRGAWIKINFPHAFATSMAAVSVI